MKVIRFDNEKQKPLEDNSNLIGWLGDLIKQVRAGEVTDVVVLYYNKNGEGIDFAKGELSTLVAGIEGVKLNMLLNQDD